MRSRGSARAFDARLSIFSETQTLPTVNGLSGGATRLSRMHRGGALALCELRPLRVSRDRCDSVKREDARVRGRGWRIGSVGDDTGGTPHEPG